MKARITLFQEVYITLVAFLSYKASIKKVFEDTKKLLQEHQATILEELGNGGQGTVYKVNTYFDKEGEHTILTRFFEIFQK